MKIINKLIDNLSIYQKLFQKLHSLKNLFFAVIFGMFFVACSSNGNNDIDRYESGFSIKKAPLIFPPDYKLRPPEVGENYNRAEVKTQYLLGDQTNPPPTELEKKIIFEVGALDIDSGVRQRLNAENSILDSGTNLSNMLLFWSNFDGDEIDFGEAKLSVDDVDAWLMDREKQIAELVGDENVSISYSKSILLPGIK